MPKKIDEISARGDERLELLFRQLGLSEKQAKIYRVLLGRKTARAALLSKKSGINRSNTYVLLTDLVRRGLVRELSKGQVKSFQAVEPVKLLQLAQQRQRDLEAANKLAEEMVPELTKEWKASVGRPVVRYYEGTEGLETVFEDIYAKKDGPVYGCVDLEKLEEVFPAKLASKLLPMRIKHGLMAYSLLGDSARARELREQDKQQLRQSILIDKTEFPMPAEIDVYEDKVAMLSFETGEFVGVIVQNAAFAQSLRSLLRLVFAKAPEA